MALVVYMWRCMSPGALSIRACSIEMMKWGYGLLLWFILLQKKPWLTDDYSHLYNYSLGPFLLNMVEKFNIFYRKAYWWPSQIHGSWLLGYFFLILRPGGAFELLMPFWSGVQQRNCWLNLLNEIIVFYVASFWIVLVNDFVYCAMLLKNWSQLPPQWW